MTHEPFHLTPESVASLPPPGLAGPSHPLFAPHSSRYLAFISVQPSTRGGVGTAASSTRSSSSISQPAALYSPLTGAATTATSSTNTTKNGKKLPFPAATTERVLMCVDLEQVLDHPRSHPDVSDPQCSPLIRWSGITPASSGSSSSSRNSKRRIMEDDAAATSSGESTMSLEERLRRERQRLSTGGSSMTQFSWAWTTLPADTIGETNIEEDDEQKPQQQILRLLVPARGRLFIQDGIMGQSASAAVCIHDKSSFSLSEVNGSTSTTSSSSSGGGGNTSTGGAAIDPQLSPDGCLVAWTCQGELYVKSATALQTDPATRVSFGADDAVSHGVADFVAQEEMDRYRGFWWHAESNAILFTRTDESPVPMYRIMHQDGDAVDFSGSCSGNATSSSSSGKTKSGKTTQYEDHRYPFAGKENPVVSLGLIKIDRESILQQMVQQESRNDNSDSMQLATAQEIAIENWEAVTWIDPPREASEYLARVYWLPDGTVAAQWQNRSQNVSVLYRIDLERGKGRTLVLERSDVWINLHHMFEVLPRPIHPDEFIGGGLERDIPPMPYPLPDGSFSFLVASERSGFSHLYLYTYVPGINGEQAVMIKAITGGDWVVESIAGVDMANDVIYCTGTYDSPLERHLYAVPFLNNRVPEEELVDFGDVDTSASPNGVRRGLSKVIHALSGKSGRHKGHEKSAVHLARQLRCTLGPGMHSIVMDANCRYFVDTSSDLSSPTTVKVYELPREGLTFPTMNGATGSVPVRLIMTLYDALQDDKGLINLISSPDSALSQTDCLAKALPPPELLSLPTADGTDTLHAALYRPDPLLHGPGPYPLVCAVYGGPHVQRVHRSWSQTADLRAQRLRSLGFCVVKCDNRGSSRRGISFESAIAGRLGRLEVLDQVAVVRQLVVRGVADGSRVGIYGWSYGGYLAAMCLCRAPDVFHVAVAGAPVTSWDGYDTHYTERYMGLPEDNPSGYRESAVFDHVPNMQGKLLIVHGLIDENVHFRHTARLINKLIASGKEYDLLIFPEERHSPRRLRDRIYMEQRISDYIVRHLGANRNRSALDLISSLGPGGLRSMAGHL
jgi:dipeptidyl-peptidase 4